MNLAYRRTCQSQEMVVMKVEMATATQSPQQQQQLLKSPTNGHSPSSQQEDERPYKKVVRYKECLKNHAAAIGGNATDGCGEFIPGGEEGSLEALKCSACNCHRNFHRKEMDGECSYDFHHHYPMMSNIGSGRLILGHHNGFIGSPPQGYPASSFISSRAPPPHQVVVSYKKWWCKCNHFRIR
ncbi:hypothetical protein OIU77_021207 [Salix suchowensis]|uniref:ZF-HD dimerization-type domain-containing protein n=1 Tax=Salix suchowensis TaxID=1278906 RepID=A0ABQ9C8Z7_9ROSI|nr:hypothetical protein OIU77_021207 [Salix suchowensis]